MLLSRAIELCDDAHERALLWREIGLAHALRFDGDAFWAAMETALKVLWATRSGRKCSRSSRFRPPTARACGAFRPFPSSSTRGPIKHLRSLPRQRRSGPSPDRPGEHGASRPRRRGGAGGDAGRGIGRPRAAVVRLAGAHVRGARQRALCGGRVAGRAAARARSGDRRSGSLARCLRGVLSRVRDGRPARRGARVSALHRRRAGRCPRTITFTASRCSARSRTPRVVGRRSRAERRIRRDDREQSRDSVHAQRALPAPCRRRTARNRWRCTRARAARASARTAWMVGRWACVSGDSAGSPARRSG